ncbi:MAG: YncE family protein [Candidatus Glassbacteria bacterium]
MKNVLIAIFFTSIAASNAISQLTKSLYVVNGLGGTLSKVDLENGTVYDDIVTLGDWPNDIVVRGDRAYVINSGSADMYVIDLLGDSLLSVIDLGEGNNPWSAAFYDDETMYVTNFLTNTVSKVDVSLGEVVSTIGVGVGPEGLLVEGGLLYVANTGVAWPEYGDGTVSVIDLTTESVIDTVTVGKNAQDLVMDPQGELNVICTGDYATSFGTIYCVDSATGTVTDSVWTGGFPARAAITGLGFLYAAAGGWIENGEVYLHNTISNTLLHGSEDPITTGTTAMDVAVCTEGYMYAVSFDSNTVSVYDIPDEYVTDYQVGQGPTAIALWEAPWIEVNAVPERRIIRRGGTLVFTVNIEQTGTDEESVRAMSFLVLPGGVPFAGNPVIGPFSLTLTAGESHSVELSGTIPDAAPVGRYVLYTIAFDTDSRRKAVDSFWFHVIP